MTDPRAMRALLVATARDPRKMRALRLALLRVTAMAPCTNVQELVFGPAADVRNAFARAREQLARYPSEAALLDVIYETPERLADLSLSDLGMRERLLAKVLTRAADVAGALLRNRRLPGCARVLLAVL